MTTMRGRAPSAVDAQKWAELLREMLTAHGLSSEGAAKANGGPVPASAVTIRRWLAAHQGVTADMVCETCRALGYPPARALVMVGVLAPDELGITGLLPLPLDPARRLDPLAARINAMLANSDRPQVRRVFQAAYDALALLDG